MKVVARYQRNTAGPTPHNVFDFVGACDSVSEAPILANHDPSAVVGFYAGAPGDTSRPLMQFEGVQIVGKHSDPKREPIAFVVADPTPQFEPEAIPAFDPAALRKVLA